MRHPTIVVTGALGHIGSKFIHGIQKGQYREVRLVDNLSSARYASLWKLPAGTRFRFFEEDILTADLARRFGGADRVLHLAALSVPEASFEKQAEVEKVNFEGTRLVARACVKAGAALLFVSTTSIYTGLRETLDEEATGEKIKAPTPYAQSKLRAERMLFEMGREAGLRFTIFRFGTIFGPSVGMRFTVAVNRFCWQACQGRPLTIWKTALDQTRPYLDLADARRAVDFALRLGIFDGNIYNVVTCNATVRRVAALIRRHVPSLKIRKVESKAMSDYSYSVSSKKWESRGFRFHGSLERGIRDTLAWLGPVSRYARPVREGKPG